jgi:Fe-S cluster assembly ATP-binding protein
MLKITNLTAEIIEVGKIKRLLNKISLQIQPGEIHVLMGPNGAGKSSLVKAIMGYPELKIGGKISLNDVDISAQTPDIRSKAGLFISHQHPVEIPGVRLLEFLKTAYNEQREPKDRVDVWSFLTIFQNALKETGLPEDFTDRELNAGFSGGEKKKSELLQLIVLKPKYAVLDEIDSGLDVDSLKQVYSAVTKLAKENQTGFLIITHNPEVLNHIKPTKIHILKKGKITESGGIELAGEIVNKGFNK